MAGVALTGMNRDFACMARYHGILQDIDEHRVDVGTGVILVCCGDGDHSSDIFKHQEQLFRRSEDRHRKPDSEPREPRIHLVTLNGGPLVLVKDSPLHVGMPQDEVAYHSIVGAVMLGKGTVIALMPHTCGAAMKVHGMSLQQVFFGLQDAHDRTTAEIHDRIRAFQGLTAPMFDAVRVNRVCVRPYMHIDWGQGRKKTYFIDLAKLNMYRADEMPFWENYLQAVAAGWGMAPRQQAAG